MSAQGRVWGEQQQCLGELNAKMNQFTNAVSQALLVHPSPVVPTSSLVSRWEFASETFLVTIATKHNPIILGFPWMQHHDPQISWHDKEITKWLKLCHYSCLHLPHIVVASTTVKSLNFPVTTVIPEVYHEFTEVFSKTKAGGIPPHRPYDCTIDLLPGTTPPRNHIYPLSLTEQKAMED